MLFLLAGLTNPVHITGKQIEVFKMASVALTRISGSVLSVPTPREGVFKPGTERAGERWRIETVNVLVADQNVTAVTLPRRDDFGQLPLSGGMPAKGDIVDFLCEVSIYRQDLQVRVIEDWPADDVSNTLAA